MKASRRRIQCRLGDDNRSAIGDRHEWQSLPAIENSKRKLSRRTYSPFSIVILLRRTCWSQRLCEAMTISASAVTIFPVLCVGVRPALLRRMGVTAALHGFRSTFRDWASERTNYPRDVAEMALAHSSGDKLEAAYRIGDVFEKCGRKMTKWARFCGQSGPTGDVVSIRRLWCDRGTRIQSEPENAITKMSHRLSWCLPLRGIPHR